MTQAPLSLANICKSFSGKRVVDDVSFTIQPGEIVGFLGPNGAGKTTTLRIALGLVQADKGQVAVFGHAPGAEAFGRIGFLPEERGLYKKQTAREAIIHMARLNGVKGRDAAKIADRLLDQYGLGEAKHKKNNQLSKGMAQKVQLLSAIAHDPEFYILDEPFSGLDPVNQQILQDMVREIAQKGRTIIFSTHVMEHAERLCDRIILMSGGRKVFDGSMEAALMRAPRRLTISSGDPRLAELITPYAEHLEQRDDGVWVVILKAQADTQALLERCVREKVSLSRFNPQNPSLHEAFVAIVGRDEMAKMELSHAPA